MKNIILASSSPRRKELLAQHKINFKIDFIEIDEVLDYNLALPLRLEKLAYQKALPISKKYPSDIIIGADTMVCLNGEMLGKPKDRQEAFAMLKRLAGKTQTVYSAVAIINGNKVITFHDCTDVTFKKLADEQINEYLDCKEWIGKAGGYAIQGIGKNLVDNINGDIETVIGLPVVMIENYLKNELEV